jgi:hypothetical protein
MLIVPLLLRYYKRYELQWRLSLFFSASILAGGFGGVRDETWLLTIQC